jgi:hypothetical protein
LAIVFMFGLLRQSVQVPGEIQFTALES